jgi:aminoglycoside 6-adenylyltransferase
MDDPEVLLASILEWAREDPRVTAVVQTGSRARDLRVDQYSDLDIELIGPGWEELAADDSWFHEFGDVMVVLPLTIDDTPDGEPSWHTRLVVYSGGRKVDFTLAGEQRINGMVSSGLNPLYDHGFVVRCDKSGLLGRLPPPRVAPPDRPLPREEDFHKTVTEFWFEASQVPIYLARNDLWVVKFREHTMRQMLLRALEWFAQTNPSNTQDTWHIGHHMNEWLPDAEWSQVGHIFSHLDAEDTLRALRATMALFESVSTTVAERMRFQHSQQLPSQVLAVVERIATSYGNSSERHPSSAGE